MEACKCHGENYLFHEILPCLLLYIKKTNKQTKQVLSFTWFHKISIYFKKIYHDSMKVCHLKNNVLPNNIFFGK